MDINTRELQKFLDTFGPVLSAIPAVINAADHAKELERHLAILSEQRDAVVEETERRKEDLSKSVEKARASLTDIDHQRSVKLIEHRELTAALAAEVKAERAALIEFKAKCAAEKEAAAAEAAKAEAERDSRIAAVQADIDAAKVAGEAEIVAIEERRAAAQKTLDDLRASLQG